jgi:excisionase family DNA binding protein
MTASRLLKVPEAAAMLALSQKTARQWIGERRIGVIRLGRAVRVPFLRVSGTVIAFEWEARFFWASSNGIGTELYHAKWRRGARKSLARSQQFANARSDDWVDEARGPI